jgi:alpha-galactosidase
MNKDKETAIRALMLDPLTAAVCSLAEIRSMANELFEAERKFLPDFK